MLRGAPGSGRSTLVAAWAVGRREANPRDIVVCRFVGLTESSQTWSGLLRSIAAEVAIRTGRPVRLPEDDLEVPMAAARLFMEVQAERRVVVCVDGLDQLLTPAGEEDVIGRGLGWVPQAGESTRLSFVPIVASDNLDDDAQRAYAVSDVNVPSLSYADRLALTQSSLTRVDRNLPPEDVRLSWSIHAAATRRSSPCC